MQIYNVIGTIVNVTSLPIHVPAFIAALEPFIHQYGYAGVGGLLILEDFGLPVPGETTLITAAFFAGFGQLNILIVFLVGFLGAVIGDNIGFAIGQYGGHPLIEQYGKYVFITPERLAKIEAYFNHNGGKIVMIARFIEGLRQANGIIAGISAMRWRRFIIFNIVGAFLWVGVWSSVGYLGGSHITILYRYSIYVTIVLIIVAVLYIGYRIAKLRSNKDLNGQAN